jgi:hypothetical protein
VEARTADWERGRLLEFLNDLRCLLTEVLEGKPSLLDREVHRLFLDAWGDLIHDGTFDQLEKSLGSGDYDFRLREHGLYGAQLELKAQLFQRGYRAVNAERQRRPTKRWKRLLGWTLKAANVLLGSLAEAVPAAAPIKEFKEALETALDEEEPLRDKAQRWWQRLRPWRR